MRGPSPVLTNNTSRPRHLGAPPFAIVTSIPRTALPSWDGPRSEARRPWQRLSAALPPKIPRESNPLFSSPGMTVVSAWPRRGCLTACEFGLRRRSDVRDEGGSDAEIYVREVPVARRISELYSY